MAYKIDTVSARNKLEVRGDPYWHRVSKGFSVGFRKMSQSSAGTWLLRKIGEDGHKTERSLGALEDCPQYARFDTAVELAREILSPATVEAVDTTRHSPPLWMPVMPM